MQFDDDLIRPRLLDGLFEHYLLLVHFHARFPERVGDGLRVQRAEQFAVRAHGDGHGHFGLVQSRGGFARGGKRLRLLVTLARTLRLEQIEILRRSGLREFVSDKVIVGVAVRNVDYVALLSLLSKRIPYPIVLRLTNRKAILL